MSTAAVPSKYVIGIAFFECESTLSNTPPRSPFSINIQVK